MDKCDRKPSLKRVVRLIELISLFYENTPKTHKDAEEVIGQIYRFSHLHGNCENPHYDWRREFYEVEKQLEKFYGEI